MTQVKLREKIDREALAGIHRVIPAVKEDYGGKPIDAYLTSASINKILDPILALIPEIEKQEYERGYATCLLDNHQIITQAIEDAKEAKKQTLKEVGRMLEKHSCRIRKSDVGHWGTILSKEAIETLEKGELPSEVKNENTGI